MTEQLVDEARYMVRLPPELRHVGVLTEPLAIAQKALEQLWLVQARLPWSDPELPVDERGWGHRALVLGAGPVGLLGAMALIRTGFETTVYSGSPAPNPKATLAESIGARYVASREHDLDTLVAEVGPPDVVYEAAGVAGMAIEAAGILRPNGVLVLTGVAHPKQPRPLDSSALVLGNQLILGTVNAGRSTYEAAADSLAEFNRRWPEQLSALVTGRHPMERAQDVLAARSRGIKDVITIGAAA
jgi:threonine dehydrogenase-like Zn-dependent dehydrogenase